MACLYGEELSLVEGLPSYTETPQVIELFIHFFMNSIELFTWESAKLSPGTGWLLVRHEGSVTLGASQLLNTFGSRTRSEATQGGPSVT